MDRLTESSAIDALLQLSEIPSTSSNMSCCFKLGGRYLMTWIAWPPRNDLYKVWDLPCRPPIIIPKLVIHTLETLFIEIGGYLECCIVASIIDETNNKRTLIMIFSINGQALRVYYGPKDSRLIIDYQSLEML